MKEKLNPNESFPEYLKRKKGKPIDSKVKADAEREMVIEKAGEELKLGEKGGYAIGGKPYEKIKLEGNLGVSLSEADLTIEKLEEEIRNLAVAKELVGSLFMELVTEDVGMTTQITLIDLENRRLKLPKGKQKKILKETRQLVDILASYDFNCDAPLLYLLGKIKEKYDKKRIILDTLISYRNREESK